MQEKMLELAGAAQDCDNETDLTKAGSGDEMDNVANGVLDVRSG